MDTAIKLFSTPCLLLHRQDLRDRGRGRPRGDAGGRLQHRRGELQSGGQRDGDATAAHDRATVDARRLHSAGRHHLFPRRTWWRGKVLL